MPQLTNAEDAVDFNRDIRPILSDNCFYCHGPDEGQRVTDLRFDTKEGAMVDLGGYAAIVPGEIEKSELVERIRSSDPDFLMPPPEHRKKLSQQQKDLLVEWIKQGANWDTHWSFVPPIKAETPEVNNVSWPLNFIDNYVLSVLESRGIETSPEAVRHVLLRRLCFDLTGLPPSLDDLQAFSLDQATYERTVDRLLASPHFGERMAVYWLDLVRYADSVGYHGDQPVSVSPYRDYVIDVFNQNVSFDQFTREQLAGDLLEEPGLTQLVASGYNRLGMMSAEGGVQPEEYLAKYAADRVRTTASVWLGVTFGCAECHDHKFDPLSTREFYEFAAFFADIKEKGLYEGAHQSNQWGPSIDVPDALLPALLEPIDVEILQLQHKLVETPEIAAGRLQWEKEIRQADFRWQTLRPRHIATDHEVETEILDDGSVLISGSNPDDNVLVATFQLPKNSVQAFRLQALPHESLPKGGPGRAGNGNFVVTEFLALQGDFHDKMETLKRVLSLWPTSFTDHLIRFENATATIEQAQGGEKHPDKKWSAASTIDRDANGSTWGWAILPEAGKANELVVQVAAGQSIGDTVTLVIQQYHGQGSHTLGHFRLSYSSAALARANPFHSLPQEIKATLSVDSGRRTAEQQKRLSDYYLTIAPLLQQVHQKIAALQERRDELVQQHTRTSLITVAVPPRPMRVLPRGNWMDKSGPMVQPNTPASLGRGAWDQRATRKELADWVVSANNPLTARVFVNRLWKMFYGNGLANVLDDLGSQGQPPSHPELLDRLSVEFIESGWDVKHIVKLMVMSRTYRQSSALRNDLKQIDPENRLLARQTRFRLDAEFVRDNALAVSDLLVRTVGGRSVKPYQPPGLYRHLNFPTREYEADKGENQYRRGVYTHWQRQYLHPAMRVFDAPPREECTAARPRSSTPLAALVLLNDPSFVEAAKVLAANAVKAHQNTDARLKWIFLKVLSRAPRESESDLLRDLVRSHLEFFNTNEEAAIELLAVGQTGPDQDLSRVEHAAWTSVCRAVMNMHEFVMRY